MYVYMGPGDELKEITGTKNQNMILVYWFQRVILFSHHQPGISINLELEGL